MSIAGFPWAKSNLSRVMSLISVLVLAGCGRDEIRVYKVGKEVNAAQGAVVPKDWHEAPPGEMRFASYHIQGTDSKSAEVSVVPLPVTAARDLDNVNRWRGAVSLPPVTEAELQKLAQTVPIGDHTGTLYDQAGENSGSGDKERILVAVLRTEQQAWFFKMSGDNDVVSAQKEPFLGYLKSFNVHNPAANRTSSREPGMEEAQLPPSHPPIGDMTSAPNAGPPADDGNKPDWKVPDGWKETTGQMLVAKFLISGADNSQAAVNVSMTGGGLVMNVNRWRGQLGLSPAAEGEIEKQGTPVDTQGGKATLFDMSGKDAKTGDAARILGIVLLHGDQTWYYKLMGSPNLVDQNKEKFLNFVKTVKYRS